MLPLNRHLIRTHMGMRGAGLYVDVHAAHVQIGFRGGNTGKRAEIVLPLIRFAELQQAVSDEREWSVPYRTGVLEYVPDVERQGALQVRGPRGGTSSQAWLSAYGVEDLLTVTFSEVAVSA